MERKLTPEQKNVLLKMLKFLNEEADKGYIPKNTTTGYSSMNIYSFFDSEKAVQRILKQGTYKTNSTEDDRLNFLRAYYMERLTH